MSLVPYLRAKLGPLHATKLVTRYNLDFDGALVLPARLGWAAGLSELDCVEVRCPARRLRLLAHVLFGAPGQIQLWAHASCGVRKGDDLHVAAYAWRRRDEENPPQATRVLVGRENAPLEIRRVVAQEARLDSSCVPLLPRAEAVHSVQAAGKIRSLEGVPE